MEFRIEGTDAGARAGILRTAHGEIHTPVFMPVGTQGAVKAVTHQQLVDVGFDIILGNTYHLFLRPGTEILRSSGGLHRFAAWDRSILTDSGGFQVYSLAKLRKVDDDGVTFQSHLDGSPQRFTPERVMGIQRDIGADIMMVFDECPPYPCEEGYAAESNSRSIRWAAECREYFDRVPARYDHEQALFGIVQGSVYPQLRESSARALCDIGFDGYAIGGLAVGEPAGLMYDTISHTVGFLPDTHPRYLMGVGTPENLLESVERGIDMFDCVLPTRNGRNAMAFTRRGPLNLNNARFSGDNGPIEENCRCYACNRFSRSYIRHLFNVREILGLTLVTLHNLTFYRDLMSEARSRILAGTFRPWKTATLKVLADGKSTEYHR